MTSKFVLSVSCYVPRKVKIVWQAPVGLAEGVAGGWCALGTDLEVDLLLEIDVN